MLFRLCTGLCNNLQSYVDYSTNGRLLQELHPLLPHDQFIAGFRPGPHSTGKIVHIFVSQLRQRSGGDNAHVAAAAINDYFGIFILGEFVNILFNLIEWDKKICFGQLSGIRDMHIYQKKILLLQLRFQLCCG